MKQLRKGILILLFITILLLGVIVIFPAVILNNSAVMEMIEQQVEQNFGFKIGKIKWSGWSNVMLTNITLNSQKTEVPVEVDRIRLSLNPVALLTAYNTPEKVVSRVELLNPKLKIERYQDGSWNFDKIIPKSSGNKRASEFNMTIKVINGDLEITDSRFGIHRLQSVTGFLNLKRYPQISWSFDGKYEDSNFGWSSQGKAQINQRFGMGNIKVVAAPVSTVKSFIPQNQLVQISNGQVSGGLNFIWNEGKFKITKGDLILEKADVSFAAVKGIYIKELQTAFSDSNLLIKKALFSYKENQFKLKGSLNPLNSTVGIQLSSESLNIEELSEFFPALSKYQFSGTAALKLNLKGLISEPEINGEVLLNEGTVVIDPFGGIDRIAANLQIVGNDLLIKKLEGNWSGSLISLNGRIKNLYRPQFELVFDGINVDVAQWLSGYPNTLELGINSPLNWTGSITGGLDSLSVATKVNLDRLSYQNYSLENIALEMAWNINERIIILKSLTANVWDGDLAVQGSVRVREQELGWEIVGGLTEVNLSRIDINPEMAVLDGDASVSLISKGNWKRGTKFDLGLIIGGFKSKEIHYQDVVLNTVEGTFNYLNGRLCIESVRGADAHNGKVYGNLAWEQNKIDANISVEGLNLATLIKETNDLEGIFRGSMVVTGPVNDLTAVFKGEFQNITWQDKLIGNITGELIYAQNEIKIDALDVDSTVGDFAVQGSVVLQDDFPLNLVVSSDNTNIDDFLKLLPVKLGVKLDGIGELKMAVNGPVSNANYSLTLNIDQPAINNIVIQKAYLDLEGSLNQLQIRQFQLKNSEGEVQLAGTVTQDNLDLVCKGVLNELQSLGLTFNGKIIEGKIDFEGRITGDFGKSVISAEVIGQSLAFGNLKYESLVARAIWDAPVCKIEEAILEGEGGKVKIVGDIKKTDNWNLDLDVAVADFPIKELLEIANAASFDADGKLSGKIIIGGNLATPEIRASGNIANGLLNGIEVAGAIDIFYNQSQLTIEKIELAHQQGTLNIKGNWLEGNLLKLNATVREFPIAAVASVISNTVDLDGVMSADINLEWSEKLITGDYQLDLGSFGINGTPLGELSVAGHFTDQGLQIQSGNWRVKTGSIKVAGYLPWPEKVLQRLNLPIKQSERNLSLNLNFTGIPTEYFNLYPEKYRLANGRLDGYLTIDGDLKNPICSGRLTCNEVSLYLPQYSVEINSIEGAIEISSNRAVIKSLYGNTKKGTIDVAGEALITPQGFKAIDLTLNGSKIYLKHPNFDGFGDLEVKMQGDMFRPLISGDIKIYDCKISLGSANKSKQSRWSPQLDLTVSAGRNVRYRQVGLADVEVDGTLDITGEFQKINYGGKITSNVGMITIYGQNFKINQAMIVFNPANQTEPYLEVESSLRTSKAEIFLIIKGHLGPTLMFDLSSQPNLSQSEIYALLNWSDLVGEEPLTASGIVGGNLSFVTDTLFGNVLFEIRKLLGVDYLYLETDYPQNEVRINMADYITDQLYVSYSMLINGEQSKSHWEFDYYLNSSFTAGATYSVDDGTTWKLTYRIKF
jgi:autotransporter translocation and assembly factor TamB